MNFFPEVDRDDDSSPKRLDRRSSVPPPSGMRKRISLLPPPNDSDILLESAERELAMAESIVKNRSGLAVDPDPLLTQQWVIRLSSLRIHVKALRLQKDESLGSSEHQSSHVGVRHVQKDTLREVLFVFDPEDECA